MYWAHRAVIFAIAQLSCICRPNQRDFVDKIIVVSLFSNVGYRLPEVRGSEWRGRPRQRVCGLAADVDSLWSTSAIVMRLTYKLIAWVDMCGRSVRGWGRRALISMIKILLSTRGTLIFVLTTTEKTIIWDRTVQEGWSVITKHSLHCEAVISYYQWYSYLSHVINLSI